QRGQCVGVEIDRVELAREPGVHVVGDPAIVADPLVGAGGLALPLAAQHGVEPEVHEHPEPGLLPPGQMRGGGRTWQPARPGHCQRGGGGAEKFAAIEQGGWHHGDLGNWIAVEYSFGVAGNWKLETGNWKLDTGSRGPAMMYSSLAIRFPFPVSGSLP